MWSVKTKHWTSPLLKIKFHKDERKRQTIFFKRSGFNSIDLMKEKTRHKITGRKMHHRHAWVFCMCLKKESVGLCCCCLHCCCGQHGAASANFLFKKKRDTMFCFCCCYGFRLQTQFCLHWPPWMSLHFALFKLPILWYHCYCIHTNRPTDHHEFTSMLFWSGFIVVAIFFRSIRFHSSNTFNIRFYHTLLLLCVRVKICVFLCFIFGFSRCSLLTLFYSDWEIREQNKNHCCW